MGTKNRSRQHSGVYARDGCLVNRGEHRASATVLSPFVRSNEKHLHSLRTKMAVSTLVGTVAAALSIGHNNNPSSWPGRRKCPRILRGHSPVLGPVREGVPGTRDPIFVRVMRVHSTRIFRYALGTIRGAHFPQTKILLSVDLG